MMERHFLPQSDGFTSGFLHIVFLGLKHVPTEAFCCFMALRHHVNELCRGYVSLEKNLLL